MAAPEEQSALGERLAATADVFLREARVDAHFLPDQSLLLFHRGSETAFPLNESGALIWGMCDGSRTAEQIVDAMAAHYDAERSEIERDTRAFLDVLVAHSLVDRRSLFS